MSLKRTGVLFAGSLLFFCAFNWLLPVTDPVESNYALTAKEMFLAGDWLSPQIYGHFWYDKPALIYWLIIIAFKFFGITDFAARFPSSCAGAATVTFAAWFYYRVYPSLRGAYIFSALLATSAMFWIMSKMVLTDAVLFALLSMALGLVWLHICKRDRRKLYIAYFFLGIAVLDKGPMAFILPALVILLYAINEGICSRSFFSGLSIVRRCFSVPGLILFVGVGLPWYLAMYAKHGNDFVNGFLGLNNFVRATVSEHPEDNHFYYYLYMVPAIMLPWTFLFFKALWVERTQLFYKYALTWLLAFVVFFTAMATKYPTYCLPVVFPMLMLTAHFLDRKIFALNQSDMILMLLPVLLVWIGMNIAAAIFMPERALFLALISIIILCGLIYVLHLRKGAVFVSYVLSATLLMMVFASFYVSGYMYQRSAKKAAAHLPADAVNIACYGDYMTSAVYYSGLHIVELGKRPDDVWAGKYVMPFEKPEEFFGRANGKNQYVMIRKNDRVKSFFKEKFSEKFRLLYADKYYFVLKRVVEN